MFKLTQKQTITALPTEIDGNVLFCPTCSHLCLIYPSKRHNLLSSLEIISMKHDLARLWRMLEKPLFEMCCFHMDIARKAGGGGGGGGGGQRLARMVWGTFFPRLSEGVRACHDGLWHFFPMFA